jgi:hypothetical protein
MRQREEKEKGFALGAFVFSRSFFFATPRSFLASESANLRKKARVPSSA